ncbi:MarR family winged helix-turn-helix transcriptional regulator [Achromobacter aloeverae]|uniref:MarR family transcriptional regulator n=1 Tax=Achromobacter aloeverae TaxID=1750518 RepID=A0A4Q1HJ24_9BURK|nr:MarR family winged helix-turn-helix transcriptional regulator [Achromobacter aloeverae]RXN88139.1 MarR family transcriptional regulator [Achromobacter aloeverae]
MTIAPANVSKTSSPASSSVRGTADARPRSFKELISFRLNMLASTWSRLAAETNQREFGVDPREWRIIGMLGADAPMSLQGLAREVNLDKSQASRTVSDMIERGLLQRGADESDGRGVRLSLTAQGKALYRKVFPRAVKRNEQLLAVLSEEERAVLDRALDVLTAHAQETLAESRKTAARGATKA